MDRDLVLKIILVLALVGVVDSFYLLGVHKSPVDNGFCDINEKFNCHMVNKSVYSIFLGVPVAVWGTLGYLAIALLSFALLPRKKSKRTDLISENNLFLLSFMGLVFALYLTSLEVFYIHFYCIFCLISQAVILTITALAYSIHS